MIAPTEWKFPLGLTRSNFDSRSDARKAARQYDKFQFSWFAHGYHLARSIRIRLGIVLPGHGSFVRETFRTVANSVHDLVVQPNAEKPTEKPVEPAVILEPAVIVPDAFDDALKVRRALRVAAIAVAIVLPIWAVAANWFYNFLRTNPDYLRLIEYALFHR